MSPHSASQNITKAPRTITTILAWVALCSIWGSTFAAIKLGERFLPPITFASARFILAFVALAFLAWFQKCKLPTRNEYGVIIKTGLLQFTVNYGLVFWGEHLISSGLTAILQATIPLFGFVIAHYTLHNERLTIKRVMGLALGIAGVIAIFAEEIEFSGTDSIIGSVAILLGAFCAAYSSVLVKSKAQTIDTSVLISGQIAVGVTPLLLYSFFAEGGLLAVHWSVEGILAVAYLAIVGTVVAFTIFYWLIKHTPVTNTQLVSLVTPVAAVLVGVVVLNETVSLSVLFGAFLILAGLTIILRPSSLTGSSLSPVLDQAD